MEQIFKIQVISSVVKIVKTLANLHKKIVKIKKLIFNINKLANEDKKYTAIFRDKF